MTNAALAAMQDLGKRPMLYRKLSAEHLAAKQARDFVVGNLRRHGVDTHVHDAQVIISELVTNAVDVSNAGEEIAVGLVINSTSILLLCWDCHLDMPQKRDASAMDENGRGLGIVASLAHEWGVLPTPIQGGKVVWASLPTIRERTD